ncbi:hypothetical protein CCUS01_11973 [Colletotrichum cuscutae]|uniref:Uncharacterized protein n=1 Tax=Colletotrichum cuscutae TaxID=1209917 RepID=A0AAI9TY59_9PEZI|nr:hypothetical protein CCUS01_11973 [Colletotrichum cuscutae]
MAAVYGRRGQACAERESEKCDTLTCRGLPVNVAWLRQTARGTPPKPFFPIDLRLP